jgi:hypothetical protein
MVCTTPVTVSGELATGNCGIGNLAPIASVTVAPMPAEIACCTAAGS